MTDTRDLAPLGVLPPAGPALRAHMAADTLRRAAQDMLTEMASGDYWQMGWARGVDNALGGKSGILVGLLPPELVLELADWLDELGCEAVRHAAQGVGNDQTEIIQGRAAAIIDRVLAAGLEP